MKSVSRLLLSLNGILPVAIIMVLVLSSELSHAGPSTPSTPNTLPEKSYSIPVTKKIVEAIMQSELSEAIRKEFSGDLKNLVKAKKNEFEAAYPKIKLADNPFLLRDWVNKAMHSSMDSHFSEKYKNVLINLGNQHREIINKYFAQSSQTDKEIAIGWAADYVKTLARSEVRAQMRERFLTHFVAALEARLHSGIIIEVKNPNSPDEKVKVEVDFDFQEETSPFGANNAYYTKLVSAGGEFVNQSILFNIPSFLIMVADLGINYNENPLAWEQFVDSLKDPVTHVGFAIFMATNHQVANLLAGVMSGALPKPFISFIGMSAGLLASSIFHDMWNDQTLRQCTKSFFRDKTSCSVAYDNWMLTRKIDAYLPSVVSLGLNSYLSGKISQLIAESKIFKNSVNKLSLKWKGIGLKSPGPAVNGVVGIMAGYLLFLGIDRVVTPKIDDFWQRTKTLNFSFETWFEDTPIGAIGQMGEYLLFDTVKLPKVSSQSTIFLSQMSFEKSLQFYTGNKWEFIGLEKCLPTAIYFYDLLPLPWSKHDTVKECILQRDFLGQVNNFGRTHKSWREYLLRSVKNSVSIWNQTLQFFYINFNSAALIYGRMINAIHDLNFGKISQGDFSKLNFDFYSQLLKTETQITPYSKRSEIEQDRLAGLYPDKLEMISTPDLIDYLLISMVCGPNPDGNSENLIKTPFGERFHFNPPRVIPSIPMFCQLPIGGDEKNVTAAGFIESRIYSSPLHAKGGPYTGLFDYIAKNIDPKIVGNLDEFSDFSQWWDKIVLKPTEMVWSGLREEFNSLLEDKLYPVLIDTELIDGCDSDDSTCRGETADRYRIANGVYKSFEIEAGHYFRILNSILYTTKTSDNEKDQAAFEANQKSIMYQLLESGSQFNLELTQTWIATMRTYAELSMLNSALKPEDYRRDVVQSLFANLDNLLVERESLIQLENVLDFSKRHQTDPMRFEGFKKNPMARF